MPFSLFWKRSLGSVVDIGEPTSLQDSGRWSFVLWLSPCRSLMPYTLWKRAYLEQRALPAWLCPCCWMTRLDASVPLWENSSLLCLLVRRCSPMGWLKLPHRRVDTEKVLMPLESSLFGASLWVSLQGSLLHCFGTKGDRKCSRVSACRPLLWRDG